MNDESAPLRRADLAAMVDHTVLRPEATRAEVEAVAVQAVELGCASVCVQPSMVSFVVSLVDGRIPVCAVVGFPHGSQPARLTADAAATVVALGATEVDTSSPAPRKLPSPIASTRPTWLALGDVSRTTETPCWRGFPVPSWRSPQAVSPRATESTATAAAARVARARRWLGGRLASVTPVSVAQRRDESSVSARMFARKASPASSST